METGRFQFLIIAEGCRKLIVRFFILPAVHIADR